MSPMAALTAKAYQVHGSSRRIISLTFWFGSARPRNSRSTITMEPTTAAIPMMWNDWAIRRQALHVAEQVHQLLAGRALGEGLGQEVAHGLASYTSESLNVPKTCSAWSARCATRYS